MPLGHHFLVKLGFVQFVFSFLFSFSKLVPKNKILCKIFNVHLLRNIVQHVLQYKSNTFMSIL